MADVVIRGYAAPFFSTGCVRPRAGADGFPEWIAKGAFAAMLADRKPVILQFATHDRAPALAQTSDGSLDLFEDDFGLAFEARLPETREAYSAVYNIVRTHQYCSVNFTAMQSSRQSPRSLGNIAISQVDNGVIDHIAIVADDAVYKKSAIWRADVPLGQAPYRIQEAAERWGVGRVSALRGYRPTRQQHGQRTGADTPILAGIDHAAAVYRRFLVANPRIKPSPAAATMALKGYL